MEHFDYDKRFPVLNHKIKRGYNYTKRYSPTIAELIFRLLYAMLKPLMAIRALFFKGRIKGIPLSQLPWIKISVMFLIIYIVFQKDIQFNFNMRSPLSLFEKTEPQEEVTKIEGEEDWGIDDAMVRKVSTAYEPVDADDLRTQNVNKFIQKYAPLAIKEMHEYKIPASIKMAQAILESRAGTSRLAKQNKNHFGIKCFLKNCKNGHCTNHHDDHHKDFFRVFKNTGKSWRAHSVLLQKPRYKKLYNYGKDYKKWAEGLKKAGYATSKTYDKKLIRVIQRYRLDQLDSL